jgi:predicted RNase H-like nuclease
VLDESDGGLQIRELGTRRSGPGEFAAAIAALGADIVAAVDAPLVVEDGRRAERELGRAFGRFGAGAYTPSQKFMAGMEAGRDLAKALEGLGFCLDPTRLTARARGRFALEVYPHAAHVAWFDLSRRIPYKKGRVGDKRLGMRAYQLHLAGRLAVEAPAVLSDERLTGALTLDPRGLRGRTLKCLEDTLDGLTCALMAVHCWRQGRDGFAVFGSPLSGYIVTPKPPVAGSLGSHFCPTCVRGPSCP